MRILLIHKTEAKWEAGVLPSPELIAGMGRLLGPMAQAGVLLGAAGLRASSLGLRLQFSGGRRTVNPGPFVPSNELIAGFTIVRVESIDEAVTWASRFADVVGDVEIDIRPVTEPWDIGLGSKPEGETTTRFMMVHKADKGSEAGLPPSAGVSAAVKGWIAEMAKAGVLLASESLRPSSEAARLTFSGGGRTVTDGPFTESKELIAGYVMLQLTSMEEAMDFAARFAQVAGDVEIDLCPIQEASDFS